MLYNTTSYTSGIYKAVHVWGKVVRALIWYFYFYTIFYRCDDIINYQTYRIHATVTNSKFFLHFRKKNEKHKVILEFCAFFIYLCSNKNSYKIEFLTDFHFWCGVWKILLRTKTLSYNALNFLEQKIWEKCEKRRKTVLNTLKSMKTSNGPLLGQFSIKNKKLDKFVVVLSYIFLN